MDIKAKLRPGPTEYLLRSPEILVKCPLIAAAAPIAVVLTPFIPELRGDVDFPLPEQKASLDLLFPYPNLMGHSLSVAVTSTNAALVGTAIVGGAAQ
jgi:hypothetical protein